RDQRGEATTRRQAGIRSSIVKGGKNLRLLLSPHILVWGWLRFVLAIAQLTLVPMALLVLVVDGIHRPFIALFLASMLTTVTSRVLFHGRPDPRISDDRPKEE